MATKEVITCDICGQPASITMTINDRNFEKEVKKSDFCNNHFNRIRSYIRHECPPVSELVDDGK